MKGNLLNIEIHPSWQDFLNEELRAELNWVEKELEGEYTPETEKILLFLKNDLYALKVVILGQDPYPEVGRATGRAFEVGDLNDWNDKFKQISLKNIIRLLHKSYQGIEDYAEIKSFNQIKEELKSGVFKILPPNQLFTNWEAQGVLLLNTSLTCEPGKPGSHRDIWDDFTEQLIGYLSTRLDLTWFLWGNDAISNERLINKGRIYKSKHPMMCNENNENDFLKSNCFAETKDLINWLGV